jgi:hypothetical protein
MNQEEFKKYVLSEAKKYLFSLENETPANNLDTIKESVNINTEETEFKPASINPSEVKKLAEEMKKINKVIDLRNPLIVSEETLSESVTKKVDDKRTLDVDAINKNKHIGFQNEGEKNKWERMLNYQVPTDEQRSEKE